MSPHAVSMKDEPTDEAVNQVRDTPTGVNAVLYKYTHVCITRLTVHKHKCKQVFTCYNMHTHIPGQCGHIKAIEVM